MHGNQSDTSSERTRPSSRRLRVCFFLEAKDSVRVARKKSFMQRQLTNRTIITSTVLLGFFFLLTASARACTIFVLTDTNRTLFFNNEDWSNPNTRIWFVPSRLGDHGYAAVG